MKTFHGLILLVILALLGILRILRPVEGFAPAPSLDDAKNTVAQLQVTCKALPNIFGFYEEIDKMIFNKKIKLDRSAIELYEKVRKSDGLRALRNACKTASNATMYLDTLKSSVPKPDARLMMSQDSNMSSFSKPDARLMMSQDSNMSSFSKPDARLMMSQDSKTNYFEEPGIRKP